MLGRSVYSFSFLIRPLGQQSSLIRRTLSSVQGTQQLQTVTKYASRPKQAEPVLEGRGCPLCRAGLHKFGYRDVLLLRQFVTPDGHLLGRRQTGVCPKMQRRITKAIKRSRQFGLLPNFKVNT